MQKAEDPPEYERRHMLWVWPLEVPVIFRKVGKRGVRGEGGTEVFLLFKTS